MSRTRAAVEWALVVAAAPVLVFPTLRPQLTIALLTGVAAVFVALLTLGGTGAKLRRTANGLLVPWTLLAVFTLVGAYVSPTPDLTLPKLAGVVLGMMILRALLLTATTVARARLFLWGFIAAGAAIVFGGVLAGPRWEHKVPLLYDLDGKIPRVILGLPGAEIGVNPTALGGSTLLFLPLFGVLAVHGIGAIFHRPSNDAERRDRRISIGEGVVCGIAVLLPLSVLALSQARGAWVSLVVVALLLIAIRLRRLHLFFVCMACALAIAWLAASRPSLSRVFGPERPYIWSLALIEIFQHPIVGAGLGSFRFYAGPAPHAEIMAVTFVAHAHNIFLQVALDTGLPGLAAYLALLVAATSMTFGLFRRPVSRHEQAVCLGLWGNLVAVHVFGLADAIALGTKVGSFVWWNLGLIAALHNLGRVEPASQP